MTLVRNAWYVAAFPAEITEKPLARTILAEPVVLYRLPDGRPVALLDICPHRFAALSDGLLRDGHLQCPYHGLEFDGTGRCVLNPHGNGARPTSLNVRAFPLVERDDLIWIWLGAPALADPCAIADFSCRIDPKRRTVGGYLHVECDYKLLIDNLMDLGHAQYLHRTNTQLMGFSKLKRDIIIEGDAIHALMMIPETPPSPIFERLMPGPTTSIDSWTDIRWTPISAMLNFIGFAPAGTPKELSMNSLGTHIITPETESTCHYFFSGSRNYGINDPAIDELIRTAQHLMLAVEDKPAVERIERQRDYVRAHGIRPAMLACDEAAVRVNREIERLERLEAVAA